MNDDKCIFYISSYIDGDGLVNIVCQTHKTLIGDDLHGIVLDKLAYQEYTALCKKEFTSCSKS